MEGDLELFGEERAPAGSGLHSGLDFFELDWKEGRPDQENHTSYLKYLFFD